MTINLTRVRRALAKLDRLVAANPDRLNQGEPWKDNLPELERLMGTPIKQRMTAYRARLLAKGYKASTIYLPEAARKRLRRLAHQEGLAYGDLIALALEQYEQAHPHDP